MTCLVATSPYTAALSGQNTGSQAAAPGQPAGQPDAGEARESFSHSDNETPAVYHPREFKNSGEGTKLSPRQWLEVGLCATAGAALCGLFGVAGGVILGGFANIISAGTAGIEAIPIMAAFGIPSAILGGFVGGGSCMEGMNREAGKS